MSRYASTALQLALGLLLSGCAAGYRLGAGPTVDTRGHVGGGVTVAGAFGIGSTKRSVERWEPGRTWQRGFAVMEVLEVGAGGELNPAGPALDLGSGWDFVRTRNEELAYRLGIRMRGHWVFSDAQDTRMLGVEAVAAGAWGALAKHHLGLELRGGVRSADGFEGSFFGSFALNLVYDRTRIWNFNEVFGF